MTKSKSTKRALLMSALALLMCVSMLIGSTFAWFTDSVTSSGNIIKSGTLDVTMEWADGTKAVPADDSTDWKDASAGAIFKSELWEPGYTEVRHIKIANEGTLALKYQLSIAANGEVTDLADVIDVYYADPAVQVTDRTVLTDANKLGTLSAVLEQINTTASGNLKAKENHTITLALKMQESAGNEYQDLAIGSDFSIQLLATQLTSEFDSFDNMYDENAPAVEVIVDTTAKLEAALEAGNKIIGVEGNAVELAAARAGQNRDMGHVTLVGLTDDATVTVTGTGGGLDNLNLKDIKVVDSTFYTSENGENAWEFTYLELGGNSTFVNVAFDDGIMSDGPMSTFVDCTFSGHNNDSSTHGTTTMYGAWVYSGKATFTNCTFTGTRGLKICDQYAGEVSNVVVDSCLFDTLSEKPGLAIDDREEESFNVVIKNSTFINCQAGDQGEYIYETDNYIPTLENNKVINGNAADTAEDVVEDFEEGTTLVKDVEIEEALEGKGSFVFAEDAGNITLDLNGKTMTAVSRSDAALRVSANTTLTITGNGTIEFGYALATIQDGATVIIENGTFYRDAAANCDSDNTAFVKSGTKGNVIINGGYFDLSTKDGDCGYGDHMEYPVWGNGLNLTINGGQFVDWDPSANVATGATVTSEVVNGSTVYTVTPAN